MKIATAKGNDLKGNAVDYLREPGTYHLLIKQYKEGLSSKDEPMDGSTIEMTVLDGNVSDQQKKEVSVTLWHLRIDKSIEEQGVTQRALTNFFIASNVIEDPAKLGDEIEIDPTLSEGHQIVMKLARPRKKGENGKYVEDMESKFLQINFSDIWHVDDPEVAKIPKNDRAIKMIDPKFRHDAAWFSFKADESNGSAPSAGGSDYDDI